MLDSTQLATYAALFFSYVVAITFIGSLHTWFVAWLGDETGQENGYGEFDPTAFLNVWSLVIFVAFQFSFMPYQPTPIQTSNFGGRYRGFKIALAFFSKSAFFLISAALFLTSFILVSGTNALSGSADSIAGLFLQQLAFATTNLSVFSLAQQAGHWYVMRRLEHDEQFARYAMALLMLIPVLILFFAGDYIFIAFQRIITYLTCMFLAVCQRTLS